MTGLMPDDCGVTATNDPHLHAVWERHGRELRIALCPEPEREPRWLFSKPTEQRP